jgi:hypothetical protein
VPGCDRLVDERSLPGRTPAGAPVAGSKVQIGLFGDFMVMKCKQNVVRCAFRVLRRAKPDRQ